MKLHPILSALRRHKTGALLIALQIALTLAIVSNAVFIIGQRIEKAGRPTGLVEDGLIRISQNWLNAPAGGDPAAIEQLDAMQRADLAALRALPDVQEVAAAASMPTQGMIWSGMLSLSPQADNGGIKVAYYYGDEHQRSVFGLRLLAGRDFRPDEIGHQSSQAKLAAPVVIVSQAVAERLFPRGGALGKTVYQDGKAATIVGVVGQLQTPTLGRLSALGSDWAYNSVLEPVRLDGTSASYALRAKPGREQAAMREARKALIAVDPMRLMPDSWGIQSFATIRDKVYRGDRGMALLLGLICLILLAVTATGITGLTSFWVGQRRKQIGVRRALGARKADILRYFQLENLFIAGAGATLGLLFAVALNLWLMSRYEMAHLPIGYALLGVAAMLVLGQAAVMVPALRASKVPPVVATRSV